MASVRQYAKWASASQLAAAAWLILLAGAATLAGWVPAGQLAPDLLHSNAPPLTPGHWLGTDPQGQDVWVALVLGARTALAVSLPAAALAAVLGTVAGVAAGYWGNTRLRFRVAYVLAAGAAGLLYAAVTTGGAAGVWWPVLLLASALGAGRMLGRLQFWSYAVAVPVDALVLTAFTLLATLPRLVLVMAVAAATEPTMLSVIELLTLTFWTYPSRLVRAEVLRVRQLPYVEAARAAGFPTWRILAFHVLPNAWRPVAATLPLSIASLITVETTLSFLGIGLPPETPSWGRLLALSRLAPTSWWLVILPGSCILVTALSLRSLLRSDKD